MAFRGLQILKILRNTSLKCSNIRTTSSITLPDKNIQNNKTKFKTEANLTFLEDPDTFGTLSHKLINRELPEDDDDVTEEKYTQNIPLPSQKLTTRQYADLIKQYLKHKRLKEAINVLEVRMIQDDRVKPENYIFNILIGACADVGYTKKAFKLFNDMKRRGLKPTGDTYTCLFTACANSPWPVDGLKNAKHLRQLMFEKGIEPNLTNYNAMIKAFGRCGDLPTAFQIVDEMKSKNISLRVHTLNHLLAACISDKNNGLRHALIVWRKLLQLREKPNIYSFNLMLRCVKDCNLGTIEDIQELIDVVQKTIIIAPQKPKIMLKGSKSPALAAPRSSSDTPAQNNAIKESQHTSKTQNDDDNVLKQESTDIVTAEDSVKIELVNCSNQLVTTEQERSVPNLLSKCPNMGEVLSLQQVSTVQDKFAIIGGQDDFLKELAVYSVKPDIKTFTQMLMVLDDNKAAELKLLEQMKSANVRADIDFYNMLIKKRCMRSDYEDAKEVREIIKKENEFRKARYSMKKKYRLQLNVMSYGVLAMTCKTKEDAEALLHEMEEKQLKVNIAILGALLRQGIAHNQFGYVIFIMNIVKHEKIRVHEVFVKHLEAFADKCVKEIQMHEKGEHIKPEKFMARCKTFLKVYREWLKEVDAEGSLQAEHPWKQFSEEQPATLQRQNITIEEPKRFFRKKRRFVPPYTPR